MIIEYILKRTKNIGTYTVIVLICNSPCPNFGSLRLGWLGATIQVQLKQSLLYGRFVKHYVNCVYLLSL